MRVRLVMSPVESDLLPIYERILSIQQERARGRVFRALLAHAGASNVLPDWFLAYPQKSFPSQRGQTVRLRIDPNDMATQWLAGRIDHLSGVDQVLEIKKVLKGLCLSRNDPLPIAQTPPILIKGDDLKMPADSPKTSLAVAGVPGNEVESCALDAAEAKKASQLQNSHIFFLD